MTDFDPATGRLSLWLPLPPPQNALFRTGFGLGYATQKYQEWLNGANETLVPLLAEWLPDRSCWWQVVVIVDLPLRPRPDAQNLLKALLDALSGHRAATISDVRLARENDEKLAVGKILKGPGLWDDDQRVMVVCTVRSINNKARPGVQVLANPLPLDAYPIDERERLSQLEGQEKARERERAREAARDERAAERQRVKDEKAEARRRFERAVEIAEANKKRGPRP